MIFGGSESDGPPVGLPTLAQRVKNALAKNAATRSVSHTFISIFFVISYSACSGVVSGSVGSSGSGVTSGFGVGSGVTSGVGTSTSGVSGL